MELERLHRCCFTGHRPEKLSLTRDELISPLCMEIDAAIEDGYTVFISGMSRGVDIWAAQYVAELIRCGSPLKLVCAVPFRGFESKWPLDWQRAYNDLLLRADLVRFISEGYSRASYHIRNHWMVDRSSRVIAVCNGSPGGTLSTINYARQCGVEVRNILDT